jgi:hypothetical protein
MPFPVVSRGHGLPAPPRDLLIVFVLNLIHGCLGEVGDCRPLGHRGSQHTSRDLSAIEPLMQVGPSVYLVGIIPGGIYSPWRDRACAVAFAALAAPAHAAAIIRFRRLIPCSLLAGPF